MFLKKARRELVELLDEDDALPSEKRAAVNLIDLRTKLEIRTQFLKFSMALNMAFLLHYLLR